MAQYMIHACPKRMWYVNEFMIPQMLEQGIPESAITVYNDVNRDGNLEACLRSFASVPDGMGTWHLQDDVLLSSKFKEQTELYNEGIVFGFSGYYDKDDKGNWFEPGWVKPKLMWSSFQCVRIPNSIAHGFVMWFREYIQHNPIYRNMVSTGKCDDWFFKMYCRSELPDIKILNLAPNIVDHVDQLIGGSVINGAREFPEYRARYWEEEELFNELANKLQNRMM